MYGSVCNCQEINFIFILVSINLAISKWLSLIYVEHHLSRNIILQPLKEVSHTSVTAVGTARA